MKGSGQNPWKVKWFALFLWEECERPTQRVATVYEIWHAIWSSYMRMFSAIGNDALKAPIDVTPQEFVVGKKDDTVKWAGIPGWSNREDHAQRDRKRNQAAAQSKCKRFGRALWKDLNFLEFPSRKLIHSNCDNLVAKFLSLQDLLRCN